MTTIAETKTFDEDTQKAVVAEIDKVKASFRTTEEKAADEETHAKPLEDGVAQNEQIRV